MMKAIEKTNNRTGLAVSPDLAAELQGTVPEIDPAQIPADGLASVRETYAEEAEPVGTMPPPATLGGVARDAAKRVMGQNAMVLMDKLGERLAFERAGVRLYQSMISKFDVHGSWDGGPTRADLERIRDEEHAHFKILERTVRDLGGDPTAMTPSADLHGEASKGIPSVVADPRTDLRESLEAILVAELVDNECWETLSEIARSLGHDEHADEFDAALEEERDHLAKVRTWLATELNISARGTASKALARRRTAAKTARTKSGNAKSRAAGAQAAPRMTKSGARAKTKSGGAGKSGAGSGRARGRSKRK